MWRRKLSAVIVKWSSSSCSSQRGLADRCASRTSCCVSVRRERREVVLAGEQCGPRAQGVEIEWPRPPERAVRGKRRADAAAQNPIAIRAGAGREARAEPGGRVLGGEHGNVFGQSCVERVGRTLRRRPALDRDRRDLPRGMDAGVGPPRHREPVPRGIDGGQRLAHDALDRPRVRLPRPPAKARPVVLERELQNAALPPRRV